MCLVSMYATTSDMDFYILTSVKTFEIATCKLSHGFHILSDDVFLIGIGLKRAGITGSIGCLWTLSFSAETKNKKDRWGLIHCLSDA